MTVLRIDPPLWLDTPRGGGLAHFLIDYGIEADLVWVCFQSDTGECWSYRNPDVRATRNETVGRGGLVEPPGKVELRSEASVSPAPFRFAPGNEVQGAVDHLPKGIVVGAFHNLSGKARYAVQDEYGTIRVMAADGLVGVLTAGFNK